MVKLLRGLLSDGLVIVTLWTLAEGPGPEEPQLEVSKAFKAKKHIQKHPGLPWKPLAG